MLLLGVNGLASSIYTPLVSFTRLIAIAFLTAQPTLAATLIERELAQIPSVGAGNVLARKMLLEEGRSTYLDEPDRTKHYEKFCELQ